eukprot:Skav234863  [mRNA]  locus=scaffold840:240587:240886:- [translate_table: standard]
MRSDDEFVWHAPLVPESAIELYCQYSPRWPNPGAVFKPFQVLQRLVLKRRRWSHLQEPRFKPGWRKPGRA